VAGLTCLFASFLKYLQHRVNPIASPLSTVVMLFIMALVLILLPLAYKLTQNGVPISLF
jgi:hypothetical protein